MVKIDLYSISTNGNQSRDLDKFEENMRVSQQHHARNPDLDSVTGKIQAQSEQVAKKVNAVAPKSTMLDITMLAPAYPG